MLLAATLGGVRAQISFPASVQATPVTGRVFVILTKSDKPDPRIQMLEPASSPPFFAADVNAVGPGQSMTLNAGSDSYPLKNMNELPAGDYTAEAFLWKYVEYHRADGHTIWAPEQWGPQVFSLEPGTLYSTLQKVHVDPKGGTTLHFILDKVVTEKDIAGLLGGEGYDTDTPWIKHIRIQSPSLSKWWGRPVYLGATILLPKGYAEHPNSHYPVVYNQGHYYQPIPWDFTTDKSTETPASAAAGKREGVGTGYEFYEAWNSDNFPRFLMVTWQHPCPFFDDSYAVNTANCGPYGDAIQNELLPYIETHYRVLREARARFTEGGSTGGWESLALQLQHPKFYGGAYVFDPDPID
ncbi:MAG: alpha/beta hydrolase-fold protein, partial [Candidatus Aquilonibacter sp.]